MSGSELVLEPYRWDHRYIVMAIRSTESNTVTCTSLPITLTSSSDSQAGTLQRLAADTNGDVLVCDMPFYRFNSLIKAEPYQTMMRKLSTLLPHDNVSGHHCGHFRLRLADIQHPTAQTTAGAASSIYPHVTVVDAASSSANYASGGGNCHPMYGHWPIPEDSRLDSNMDRFPRRLRRAIPCLAIIHPPVGARAHELFAGIPLPPSEWTTSLWFNYIQWANRRQVRCEIIDINLSVSFASTSSSSSFTSIGENEFLPVCVHDAGAHAQLPVETLFGIIGRGTNSGSNSNSSTMSDGRQQQTSLVLYVLPMKFPLFLAIVEKGFELVQQTAPQGQFPSMSAVHAWRNSLSDYMGKIPVYYRLYIIQSIKHIPALCALAGYQSVAYNAIEALFQGDCLNAALREKLARFAADAADDITKLENGCAEVWNSSATITSDPVSIDMYIEKHSASSSSSSSSSSSTSDLKQQQSQPQPQSALSFEHPSDFIMAWELSRQRIFGGSGRCASMLYLPQIPACKHIGLPAMHHKLLPSKHQLHHHHQQQHPHVDDADDDSLPLLRLQWCSMLEEIGIPCIPQRKVMLMTLTRVYVLCLER